jgi:hypothetical protein
MSFSVRLVSDLIPVEAGASIPVSIEVQNKHTETDRYELQIEGIDPEWVAIPEAVFVADTEEVRSEKVFIKVPRTSESQAGNYPFVVRVRSLNSGESRAVQGVVQVKPFNYLTMEISPKKGIYSPTRKQNVFTVTVLNLGNTEHTLHLSGSDPEEACAFEFESDQIQVSPGQQKVVEVEVVPASTPFFSGSRLHGFSITGRSVESPTVIAAAQAQMEQRPFLTPGTLTFLVLMAVVIGIWIALLPKPPSVELSLSKQLVMKGETVRVSWHSEHAKSVQVFANGVPLVADAPLNGETDYIADTTGTIRFSAKAIRDQRESEPDTANLEVQLPAPTPKPQVTLRAKRRSIELGESVELEYTVKDAVEAYLQPGPQKLVLNLNSITVQPTKEGVTEYEIVATGKDGQVATAKVNVSVIDKAKVVILAFDSKPGKLDVGGGYVTLSWQVSNAARVEITGGPETLVPEAPNAPGSQEFMIDKTTTFTIKAIDPNGRSVVKSVRVEVAQAPIIPPDQDPGSNPPVSTTGGGA